MSQEIKVTFIDSKEWGLPLNFAIGLHLVVLLIAVFLPQFLQKKPLFPDIYTIDLVNIAEPVPQETPQAPSPPPQIKEPQKTTQPSETAVSIAENASVPEPIVVKKAPISIKPLKKKKVKKLVKKSPVQPQKRIKELHRKNLAEAQEAERQAQEAARIAAAEAVSQLKHMLRETSSTLDKPNRKATAKPAAAQRSKTVNSALESQYFASVFNRLQPYWSLPEYKTWDPDLMAVVVIQIAKNGHITDQFFEQKSGDRLFDQYVLKTLQDGSPLPAIPGALQKNSLEIGLRFRPGSIQY